MNSIFGVPLFHGRIPDLEEQILKRIGKGECVTIATVNPEILLRASRDPVFFQTLSACSFCVIDGFGISFVLWLKNRQKSFRITGRDVVQLLFDIAEKKSWSVGVVGGARNNSSGRAAASLRKLKPDLRVVDLSDGHEIRVSPEGRIIAGENHISDVLREHPIDIALLGFGAPKQEYVMIHKSIPAKISVGIGGLVDVFNGDIAAPPGVLRHMGLEWVWRLFQEPTKRFTRIINAVIVFTLKALFSNN